MFPDTYIVGAPKAGTTSLSEWLASHDEVCVSVPKEPFYWAFDYPRLRAHYGFDNTDAYLALFDNEEARAATRTIDASTVYLYSEQAIPEIWDARPDARFVVCLRNPADLIVSYHRTQVVALNEPEQSLDQAWLRAVTGEGDAGNPLDPKLLDYPLVGRLGTAMRRMLDVVPADRVHVVSFDDLSSDPAGVWVRLTEFLEIPGDPQPEFEAHNTSSKMYRSRVLRNMLHRPPAPLDKAVRALRQWSRESDNKLVSRAKGMMWRSEGRPSVSPELAEELREYFRSDIEELSTLVGRDFGHWLKPAPAPESPPE